MPEKYLPLEPGDSPPIKTMFPRMYTTPRKVALLVHKAAPVERNHVNPLSLLTHTSLM